MNELPTNAKTKWIPDEQAAYYEQLAEHAAWYSGDSDELTRFYSTKRATPGANGRFWGENSKSKDHRTIVHTPIAGDIATFSSDILFSEIPEITIPEAHERKNNELIKNDRAVKAEERLLEIIDKGGVVNRLLEAGETASAMGGVFLKPTWDSELTDVPILTIAQPDNVIPVFKYGFLSSLIFHKIVFEEPGRTIRLLEHYTKGAIETKLYSGDDNVIGKEIPLTSLAETKDIAGYIDTKIDTILARYVANKRPHKRFRGTSLGMSDFQGSETLMDALDLTMTSWMRDIALGRGRLHVTDGMLNPDMQFDAGAEVYVELDIEASMLGDGKNPMFASQFQIRTEEHYKTAVELTTKIIHMAGFAPQSFGLHTEGGSSISTESHEIRERKTLITKQKKERFFKDGLEDIFKIMLEIDNVHLGNDTPTEYRPNVAFADTLGHDIGSISKTIETLQRAQSASIHTRVEMLHPDWSPEEVEQEVERIRDDENLNVQSPMQIGGKEYDI